MRPRQHPVDRRQAAGGVLGALSGRRSGEAHLWLLFEEAIGVARRDGDADPAAWEVRRAFRGACDALVAIGAVAAHVAAAIVAELEDALALRGHLAPTAFTGQAFPDPVATTAATGSVDAWFEAEIVRHLDLLGDLDPAQRRPAAADTLRILTGPARALTAASGGREAQELLGELASSFAAAGLGAEPTATPPRRAWVRFLRGPALTPLAGLEPAVRRGVQVSLGELAGGPAVIAGIGWSPDLVEIRVRRGEGCPVDGPLRWLARSVDPVAGLHAGQPGVVVGQEILFRLRPGLREVASPMAVTVVAGAEAAIAEVPL